MKQYAAIDLYDGKVVRLQQGDYNKVTEYGDPYEIAKVLKQMQFDAIHIINLNGARGEKFRNLEIIARLSKDLDVPIQVGGGIRTVEDAIRLLDMGVNIIISTMFFESFDDFKTIVDRYPNRVLVSLDIKNGNIMTRGWLKDSNVTVNEVNNLLNSFELAAVIITNIVADGMQSGADKQLYKAIKSLINKPLIAAGGISTLSDLQVLESIGYEGAIIGRALYENSFTLVNNQVKDKALC
jgi:phosphoribosylformimino-5-aminoimidazole carboxamide ribotide isomerase